jgi:gamma-glutamylcyclotransferase (GGCT)/AIG2-like uncharacterized protein YtfP
MDTYNIFSYGTLQNIFGKNRPTRQAALMGAYEMMPDDYPLLRAGDREGNVIEGVIFEVTGEELDAIDDYEEMPHLFKRQEKTVMLADGGTERAWVYLLHE